MTWPPYRIERELLHRCEGRPAIVMGGGESLNDDVMRDLVAIEGGVCISANDHGGRWLRAHGLEHRLDWQVCLDKIETRMREYSAPVVTRHMWGDYRLLSVPRPGKSSGIAAAYVARLLGCTPIVLIGMDCYQGATYHDAPKAESTGRRVTLKEHMARWREFKFQHPANYQAAAGILQSLFPPWGGAQLTANPTREQLASELAVGIVVRFQQPWEISGRPFVPGDIVELKTEEAQKCVARRVAVRWRTA